MEQIVLKIASHKATTVDGVATLYIKVPGTTGRVISQGSAWFTTHHPDDKVEIYITLEDETVVGSYTDESVDGYQVGGWYFPPNGIVTMHALDGYGFIPSGLILKIIATKGDLSSDAIYTNLAWGALEE